MFCPTTTTHTYDAVDRRIGESVSDDIWMRRPAASPSTVSYTADALNQYSAVGAATPTYDDNGNLTYDGTFTYVYDAENRLTGITGGGVTASYAYDARGRRKSRTVGGTTTIYVTDPEDREILEYNGSTGAVLAWTAFGPGADAPLARMDISAGTRAGAIPDVQGSVIGELASGGAPTKTVYLAYGENDTPPAAGTRYTARRLDPDSVGPAAQFMYEDDKGRRITLYVRTNRSADTTAFRFAEDQGVSLFYWLDGPLAYALVGEIDRVSLARLARAVYDELNRPSPPPS